MNKDTHTDILVCTCTHTRTHTHMQERNIIWGKREAVCKCLLMFKFLFKYYCSPRAYHSVHNKLFQSVSVCVCVCVCACVCVFLCLFVSRDSCKGHWIHDCDSK